MEDGEEIREGDDDFMDDEQSLSRSMSQMTTRGETTQPDDETHNVEVSQPERLSNVMGLMRIA